MKEKSYKILKTRNGFTIRFEHEKNSYDEKEHFVALDMDGVIKIITEDLNGGDVIKM